MNTALVILARQGSARLPMKHLYPLDRPGRNTFQILSRRLSHIEGIEKRFVAIPNGDTLYWDLLPHYGFEPFRMPGLSEHDVLGRLVALSKKHPFDKYLIVHGDSPLMPRDICQELVNLPNDNRHGAYFYNGSPGLRPRLIKKWALHTWYEWLQTQKEHALSGLQHGLPFDIEKVGYVRYDMKLTLDNYVDVIKISNVITQLGLDFTSGDIHECSDHR